MLSEEVIIMDANMADVLFGCGGHGCFLAIIKFIQLCQSEVSIRHLGHVRRFSDQMMLSVVSAARVFVLISEMDDA